MRTLVLLSLLFAIESGYSAYFIPKDDKILDEDLMWQICQLPDVFYHDVTEVNRQALCSRPGMVLTKTGVTNADHGKVTIYHYVLSRDGSLDCPIKKYLVPAQKHVILNVSEGHDERDIGEFTMSEEEWAWKVFPPNGQQSCF